MMGVLRKVGIAERMTRKRGWSVSDSLGIDGGGNFGTYVNGHWEDG